MSAARDDVESARRLLVQRLAGVRADFEESAAQYTLRVLGRLAEITDTITDTASETHPQQRLTMLRDALRCLDALDIKASRGRRKDLRAIERALDELDTTLADW